MDTIINGRMIQWARARAGFAHEELADKLQVDVSKLIAWENGDIPIPMGKAEQVAKYALVPLGILFLEKPPEDKLPIPDFRSVNDAHVGRPSPELLEVIYDAQKKQDWYREYLIHEGYEPLNYIGSVFADTTASEIATKIATTLELDDEEWNRRSNAEKTLSMLITKAEDAGIIVLRSGVVGNNTRRTLDVEEFRGFVLNDDLAPLIFINGADAKQAQLFTIVHEITHVFLGKSGITSASMIQDQTDAGIEKLCNQVSAEFLTPADAFNEMWDSNLDKDENLDQLSRFFKVSRLVVISRAFQLGFIDWDALQYFKSIEMARINAVKKQKKSNTGGGHHYLNLKYRVGYNIAQAVISEVKSGRMLYRDAFNLLGVKNAKSLNDFYEKIGIMA